MAGGKEVAGVILGTVSGANTLLGAALTLMTTYRVARDAWKAANPGADSPFKEDAELIALLQGDAAKLVDEADALLKKHGADEA